MIMFINITINRMFMVNGKKFAFAYDFFYLRTQAVWMFAYKNDFVNFFSLVLFYFV